MNVLMATYENPQGQITAGVGALLSFLPAIFIDESIQVYVKQIDYKKKIYGPLPDNSDRLEWRSGALAQLAGITWSF